MGNTQIQKGFTLIEVMIVVVIIGILSATAIAMFQLYTARAQASEAFMTMQPLKLQVIESYHGGMAFSDMDSGTGVFPAAADSSSQYITQVDVRDGVVWAQFGNRATPVISGQWLIMSPNVSTGSIAWVCAYSDASGYAFVPTQCRQAP